LIQPMAAGDVATEVSKVAIGAPVNGVVEIGGPEQFRLGEIVRRYLAARDDPRSVIPDPNARYYGAKLEERTLVPDENATIGETRFEDWLSRQFASATV
ncbi:MAG: NmrA family transcriptional regulator, partial [Gemmatimonadaceae bacterium]